MSLDKPPMRGGTAAKRHRDTAERKAKLAEVERQVRERGLVIRQARPGELEPPKRRSVAEGKRLPVRGNIGVVP